MTCRIIDLQPSVKFDGPLRIYIEEENASYVLSVTTRQNTTLCPLSKHEKGQAQHIK